MQEAYIAVLLAVAALLGAITHAIVHKRSIRRRAKRLK